MGIDKHTAELQATLDAMSDSDEQDAFLHSLDKQAAISVKEMKTRAERTLYNKYPIWHSIFRKKFHRLNMRAAAKARRVALQRTREMASVYRQCPIMRRNVMLHLLRRQRIRNPILSNDYIDGVPIVYNADHPMWSQMQYQIVRRLDQSRSSTSSSLPVIHSRSSSSSGSY